jgi:hypothetical protein
MSTLEILPKRCTTYFGSKEIHTTSIVVKRSSTHILATSVIKKTAHRLQSLNRRKFAQSGQSGPQHCILFWNLSRDSVCSERVQRCTDILGRQPYFQEQLGDINCKENHLGTRGEFFKRIFAPTGKFGALSRRRCLLQCWIWLCSRVAAKLEPRCKLAPMRV